MDKDKFVEANGIKNSAAGIEGLPPLIHGGGLTAQKSWQG